MKNAKVERVIERIKTEPFPLISDEDRRLLEEEVTNLEGQIGPLNGMAA